MNTSYSEMCTSGTPCARSDRPAPSTMASGPAMAKKTTVPTKLMNAAMVASGTGTPARFIAQIITGPPPVWDGVR